MGFLLAGEINLDLCVGRTTGSRPKTVGYFKTYPWRAGCGFGSGSTIWEKTKKEGSAAKKQLTSGRFGSTSGIRRSINAALPSFKFFQQIAPSHRHHIPARHERCLK